MKKIRHDRPVEDRVIKREEKKSPEALGGAVPGGTVVKRPPVHQKGSLHA